MPGVAELSAPGSSASHRDPLHAFPLTGALCLSPGPLHAILIAKGPFSASRRYKMHAEGLGDKNGMQKAAGSDEGECRSPRNGETFLGIPLTKTR